MKQSHRRQLIFDLATWLAAPLTLATGAGLLAGDGSNEPAMRKSRLRVGTSTLRPRIAAPKGSVKRRG